MENEIRTNYSSFNNFKGEPVKFGALIQLLHVISHKFLTLMPKESAEYEKDNLKLKLKTYGSYYSHFRVVPGFKY